MFVPGYGRTYDEGNTDRFPVDGDGFIDFCTIFPYLGSKISSDCTDDADIDNRIVQASKMFGYLRKKVLCSKRIMNTTKKLQYESYVLPSYSSAASSGGSTRRRSLSWSRSTGETCAPWPERQRTSRGRIAPVRSSSRSGSVCEGSRVTSLRMHYAGWATLHGCPSTSCLGDF